MKSQLWTAPLPHGKVEIVYEDQSPCTGVGILSLRWFHYEKLVGDVILMRHLEAPADARFRRASLDEQQNITIVFAVRDTEETLRFPLLLPGSEGTGFRESNPSTVVSKKEPIQSSTAQRP